MTSEALLRFLDAHGFAGYSFTDQDVITGVNPASHIFKAVEMFISHLLAMDPAELSMISKSKVADMMSITIETYESEGRELNSEQSEQLLADFAEIYNYVRNRAISEYEAMMEATVLQAPPDFVSWESTYRDRMNTAIAKMLQHDRFHITSFHYADIYDIIVVLAKFEGSWGTWVYNLGRDNFAYGHYFSDYATAVTDYARRVLSYAGNRTAAIIEIPMEAKR